jgi:hypothetical protein
MDYNNINNFLQSLEISKKKTEDDYNKKMKNDGCNLLKNKNKELITDNKHQDLLLNRELQLNQSINYKFQIANPQRMVNDDSNNKKNNNNEKINHYTFENNYKEINICGDNRFIHSNLNSKNDFKDNINNKLNTRENIPTKSNFNLSFD